jgi:hypothetical protein
VSGSYQIDAKNNLISISSVGKVTVEDKISQDEKILADPRFKTNMNVICDLSQATYDWDLSDIDRFRSFVKRNKTKIGKSRWAIVVAGGATEHAAKIFSVLQTAYDNIVEVQVFSNQDKALKWLKEQA